MGLCCTLFSVLHFCFHFILLVVAFFCICCFHCIYLSFEFQYIHTCLQAFYMFRLWKHSWITHPIIAFSFFAINLLREPPARLVFAMMQAVEESRNFLVIIIIRSCKSWCCPTSTGKPKHVPAPPPRASSSRESSLKYSQTLQREHVPRATKRDISVQYQTQTLPLPSSKPRQRSLDSPTPLLSNSSTSSGSHASVKYEGLLFKVFNESQSRSNYLINRIIVS